MPANRIILHGGNERGRRTKRAALFFFLNYMRQIKTGSLAAPRFATFSWPPRHRFGASGGTHRVRGVK
jgi:hypothetical protein